MLRWRSVTLLFNLNMLKKYSRTLTCLQVSHHSEHFHMYSFWKYWKNSAFFLPLYIQKLTKIRSLEYTIWPFVLLFSIIALSFMSFPYIFLHLLGNVIWKISPFIEDHLCDIFKIVHKTKETSCWNTADEKLSLLD